uniref:PNPLA domain-containing protein n=1 Tax=Rhabditophanes sp. KR3021 TaxID=114890 RepID=A0AC35TWF8_9BILA
MLRKNLNIGTRFGEELLKRPVNTMNLFPIYSISSILSPPGPHQSSNQVNDNLEKQIKKQNPYSFLKESKNVGSFTNRDKHLPLPKEIALSFSGAGTLGLYHYGVVHCLQTYSPQLMSRVTKFAGTSVGSVVATFLALDEQLFDESIKLFLDVSQELNELTFGALTPGFSMHEKLILLADKILPDKIEFRLKKVYISMTKAETNENILLDEFKTKKDLIAAISASCYIPGWSANYFTPRPSINGVTYIDGGYTNNLPIFPGIETITISPFSSKATISPSNSSIFAPYFPVQVTIGNQAINANLANVSRAASALFPPNVESLKQYYDTGFKDAFLYLFESGRLERPP